MVCLKILSLMLAALVAVPSTSIALEPSRPEQVEILPIAFSPEGLSGAGGERLRADLDNAQFVGLGEDHGFAGSPELGEALAQEMGTVAVRRGSGPLYHVVEVGPLTAGWTAALLQKDGLAALHNALQGRPWTMPFLSNVEDARLAMRFAKRDRLWGIDQEFVGSTALLLDQLAERTDDRATRELLAAWRERDNAALRAGRFDDVSLSHEDRALFADLRRRFAGDNAAIAIVDALAVTAHTYGLNSSGQYLQNNEERAALMQAQFLKAYRAVPGAAPHILFKMGAFHLGRGTTPTGIVDLGSLLPGLAAANGRDYVNVAYVPIGGRVRSIKPTPDALTAIGPHEDEAIKPILDAAAIPIDAIPATGHVLIPLAPLRHNLQGKAMRDLPAFSRALLIGFDYLVTTRDAQPATHFETWEPTPGR